MNQVIALMILFVKFIETITCILNHVITFKPKNLSLSFCRD